MNLFCCSRFVFCRRFIFFSVLYFVVIALVSFSRLYLVVAALAFFLPLYFVVAAVVFFLAALGFCCRITLLSPL